MIEVMYWIWTGIAALTLLWYAGVTLVVAYRGGKDIRTMILKLKNNQRNGSQV